MLVTINHRFKYWTRYSGHIKILTADKKRREQQFGPRGGNCGRENRECLLVTHRDWLWMVLPNQLQLVALIQSWEQNPPPTVNISFDLRALSHIPLVGSVRKAIPSKGYETTCWRFQKENEKKSQGLTKAVYRKERKDNWWCPLLSWLYYGH